MNQSDINCTIAAELLGNWLFTTSVIVNFVTSLFAVVANLLLIVCFSSVSASHKNIRILSCNVSVACVVASLFYIGRAIAFWIQSINPCNLHITSSLCNLLSIPLNTSMSSLIISMIGIAMERARASIWHADYNLNSCRMSVGICLAAWLSYCWMLLLSLKIGAPQLADGPFCVSMIMTNMMPMLIVSFVIVFHGLVVLGVYLKLIAYNRLRLRNFAEKQSHLSLESRLEMRHTIEITSMFLPSVVAHTILWIGYAVILSTLIYELVQSEVQRYSVGVCMNDLASLFMAIHPIMLFGRSERLRTKLKILLAHMLKQKLSTTQVEVISRNGSDSEEYFKGLKWAWVHNSRSDGSVYKISQM